MDDFTGEGTAVDTAAPESAVETTGPDDSNGGFNPAWEPIREKLGDPHFELIKGQLAEWDKGVNKRFESLNQEFSPYKELGSPEELRSYREIVEQINANPEAIYESLQEFLRENGRLPNAQETQDIQDELESDETDAVARDPRVDDLAKQQEQIQQFLVEQAAREEQAKADATLNDEIAQLTSERGYSQDDLNEIISRTLTLSQQNPNRIVSLKEGADQFDALRDRILSTPRPGDSAPKLLPTSGGTPTGGQQRSVGELSRSETQDLIASYLAQGKA